MAWKTSHACGRLRQRPGSFRMLCPRLSHYGTPPPLPTSLPLLLTPGPDGPPIPPRRPPERGRRCPPQSRRRQGQGRADRGGPRGAVAGPVQHRPAAAPGPRRAQGQTIQRRAPHGPPRRVIPHPRAPLLRAPPPPRPRRRPENLPPQDPKLRQRHCRRHASGRRHQ